MDTFRVVLQWCVEDGRSKWRLFQNVTMSCTAETRLVKLFHVLFTCIVLLAFCAEAHGRDQLNDTQRRAQNANIKRDIFQRNGFLGSF